MQDIIISWFTSFPKDLSTFLIAMIPVTELMVSIPLAVKVYGMPPFWAWMWSVLGTFATMVLILLILDPISKFLSRHFEIFNKFFIWIFDHTRDKVNGKMEKYGEWAIFILAATPIPLIGGMTGALAAFVFGVLLKKSIPLLLAGTMAAGGIILGITLYF